MKYTVVGFDSFSHEEFEVGSYDTLEQAKTVAQNRAGTMSLMYVYNGAGKQLLKYGSY